MTKLDEIVENLKEVDIMIHRIGDDARTYMRRIYVDFLRDKTAEALDNLRNLARAFYYVGIIESEFCDHIIRQAEKQFDELQEAAAPESCI